jgi:hypothetical protein
VDVIESVLANPERDCTTDPCWAWRARTNPRLIPIIKHDGKAQAARGLLFRTRHPNLANVRPILACPDLLCVHPGHCKRLAVAEPEPELTMEQFLAQPASDDEIAGAVYEADEPWDAQAIADLYDYDVAQVLNVIDLIRAGKL